MAALGDVLVSMRDRAEAQAPEASLRAAAVRGDLEAFEQLVRRYERAVFSLALRLTGDVEDARDAAQGVFLRMHRKLHTVDPKRSLSPWLYTVTLNVCRGIGRSRIRSRLVPMEEFVQLAAVDPTPGPERQLSAREAEFQLRAGLQQLPERERAALLLREVEELSTAEVAKLLGSSETTVRSQISSARMKLRKFFAKHAGGKR
ncbi:MAG TPA: RNA polymerase sigma factor [Verrucomicrobiae bacterium]|nr:RNA polymerase sigma factor [Verrucomicrobiae bacterium]